jgi:hypothetical protein
MSERGRITISLSVGEFITLLMALQHASHMWSRDWRRATTAIRLKLESQLYRHLGGINEA